MPELPEVETVRRDLMPRLLDRTLSCVYSHGSAKFVEAECLTGQRVLDVRRRGKYLILDLDDARELIVHLGMTGVLSVRADPSEAKHVRAEWKMDSGEYFTFDDVRRFGRISLVAAGNYEGLPTLHRMGPEPLGTSFDGDVLYSALKASRVNVKTQLLSQRPVAGVGNIYADEALWLARVHPGCTRLSRTRCQLLADAIQEVLASALDDGGTTLSDYRRVDGSKGSHQSALNCYGRGGEPCVRCAEALSKCVMQGRGTTFCARCQKH